MSQFNQHVMNIFSAVFGPIAFDKCKLSNWYNLKYVVKGVNVVERFYSAYSTMYQVVGKIDACKD